MVVASAEGQPERELTARQWIQQDMNERCTFTLGYNALDSGLDSCMPLNYICLERQAGNKVVYEGTTPGTAGENVVCTGKEAGGIPVVLLSTAAENKQNKVIQAAKTLKAEQERGMIIRTTPGPVQSVPPNRAGYPVQNSEEAESQPYAVLHI